MRHAPSSLFARPHTHPAWTMSPRESYQSVCRLIVEYGRPLTRAASPRVRDGGTRPRAMHFFPAHVFCCHALAFPRSWSLSRARSPVSRRARRVVTTPSAPLICCECAAARTHPIMRVHWSRRIARTFREWWHAASGRATITLAEHGEMLPLRVRCSVSASVRPLERAQSCVFTGRGRSAPPPRSWSLARALVAHGAPA